MNTPLSTLKAQLREGSLSKPEFIRQALLIHQTLFAYTEVARTTDIREIRIRADGVLFVLGEEGGRLICPENEARVAPIEVANFDRYEPHETRIMDVLAQNCTRIVDVGANIGFHAIRFAKRLPRAHVHAFEPTPGTYGFLQRNVAENAVGERVTCFNYGLSDRSGATEFFVAPTAGTNASLVNVAGAQDARRVVGLTMTFDEWASNHGLEPDFIKCDVEGAELLVFRGAQRTLERCRPMVFTELLRKWSKPFGYHPNDVLAYFEQLGYECLAVGEAGVRRLHEVTDETIETNYAFLHVREHAQLIDRLLTHA